MTDAYYARLDGDASWHGYLTLDNAERVQARLLRLLRGQFFTMVVVNSAFQHSLPDVRAGQWLRGVDLDLDATTAHLSIRDSYGSHGMITTAPDIVTARQWAALSEDTHTGLVYLKFKYGKVAIQHHAPGGNGLTWVFQVEDHLPELHSLADCAATATTLARHLEELAQTLPVIARWPSQDGDIASKRAIVEAVTRIRAAFPVKDDKKEGNDEH